MLAMMMIWILFVSDDDDDDDGGGGGDGGGGDDDDDGGGGDDDDDDADEHEHEHEYDDAVEEDNLDSRKEDLEVACKGPQECQQTCWDLVWFGNSCVRHTMMKLLASELLRIIPQYGFVHRLEALWPSQSILEYHGISRRCKSSCSKTMYCIYHITTLQRWFKRAESLAVVLVVPNPIGGWPGKIQVISRSFATLLWGPQLTILSPSQGQVRRHLPCQAQPGAIPCRWMMKQ